MGLSSEWLTLWIMKEKEVSQECGEGCENRPEGRFQAQVLKPATELPNQESQQRLLSCGYQRKSHLFTVVHQRTRRSCERDASSLSKELSPILPASRSIHSFQVSSLGLRARPTECTGKTMSPFE